jgi:hypothetical protein
MNDKGVAKEKSGGNGRYWWRKKAVAGVGACMCSRAPSRQG